MNWYTYVANFFAGVFFINGMPHFLHGISGERFRTPFAQTKEGSSPLVNVAWGLVNFLFGYALLFGIGNFTLGFTRSMQMFALGGVVMAVILAFIFGNIKES